MNKNPFIFNFTYCVQLFDYVYSLGHHSASRGKHNTWVGLMFHLINCHSIARSRRLVRRVSKKVNFSSFVKNRNVPVYKGTMS